MPADVTVAQGGRALPFGHRRPKAPLEPCRQGAVPIAGPREGGEHGRAGARKRIGDPRGARAQPRELAQRARRGDREGALRRRRGATADVAERDAGHIAGSALLEPTTPTSDEPRAGRRADRAPPTLSCMRRSFRRRTCAPRRVRRRASSDITAALLSLSHRRLGSGRADTSVAERRADTGDAERATSRELVVESTGRRRPCRACAGHSKRSHCFSIDVAYNIT